MQASEAYRRGRALQPARRLARLLRGRQCATEFSLSFVMLLSPTRANSSGMCVPHSFLPQRVCADHVHGGVLLTAVRDDWLTLPSEQRISPADLRGNRGRVTQRNKGAWFTAFNHAHEGKRTLLVLSDSARVWPLHMRNAHLLQVAEAVTPRTEARRAGAVVWRTAVPGHPNCHNAKGPLPSLADSSAERHLATLDMHYNWHLINETRAHSVSTYFVARVPPYSMPTRRARFDLTSTHGCRFAWTRGSACATACTIASVATLYTRGASRSPQ